MSARASFSAFYEAAHGHPPFPWQARLAEQVLAHGAWPDLLALPTGSGKTSAVDVALWAFAQAPDRHPRRVVLVVDRRVVVDQGAEHARELLCALRGATGGPLRDVADRLRSTWNAPADEDPFLVAVLRGGMPREDAWARRPDQPVLAFSTVDQVGSRLLFRGYGVSDRMASVHAGLLGHDTLLLLDEVHLAVPFAETLLAVRDRWRRRAESPLPDRWGVVRLSATPGDPEAGVDRFDLDDDDLAHPLLARRLASRKPARLEVVPVTGDEDRRRRAFVERLVAAARAFRAEGAEVVAVVVNRVDTAREVYRALGDSAVLLTGRMRPLDRDAVLARHLPRLRCGRPRPGEGPLHLVSTQAIEAGADLDFDALVTECASLDALRQRFGRLDRRGDLGVAPGAVLVRADASREEDDPVYGPALAATWTWLQSLPAVDFGAAGLPFEAAPATTRAPPGRAPVLLPAHLDAWAQTSPRPEPEPDPTLWLHGATRQAAEVQLVWRADLDEADLDAPDAAAGLIERLDACPPGSPEALSVPIAAARRWLDGQEPLSVADAPGEADPGASAAGRPRRALRWAGDDSAVVTGRELRPGDVLVVPAARGGLLAGSWDPTAAAPVADLGDRVQLELRGRATLRLHPALHPGWPPPPDAPEDDDYEDRLDEWLGAVSLPAGTERLRGRAARRILRVDGVPTALVARRRAARTTEVTTEDDRASFTGKEVSLRAHLADVGAFAERFARAVGLPEPVVADVALAARLHDLGKADPRFQRLLQGGDPLREAMLSEPLAKSALPAVDAGARRLAARRSGYPAGYRHELLSVVLAQAGARVLAAASDPELVLHLVGSHHGWCRPFAPAVLDRGSVAVEVEHDGETLRVSTDHALARVDSGVAGRFWSLNQRYGWWGLAWLEAVLRLADHRASEQEEGHA